MIRIINKSIFLLIPLLFLSCESGKSIYFKEYFTTPIKKGNIQILLRNDTIFRNRSHYVSSKNTLDYSFFNKEKELNKLLSNLSNDSIKEKYQGGNYNYGYYWFLSSKSKYGEFSTSVLDTANPSKLKKIYGFFEGLSNVSHQPNLVREKSIFYDLKFHKINKLGDSLNLDKEEFFEDEILFNIWVDLVKGEDKYSKEIGGDNFEYEINFTNLLESKKDILKILYDKKNSIIAIFLKDKTKRFYKIQNYTDLSKKYIKQKLPK